MPDLNEVGGGAKQYALRFISGKYQGGMFPLQPNREIVIGRSSDLDMVLVEDMVSRKHAKITIHDDRVFIQDLGSTNGTFVNGEKIRKARIREGDRILIGTSILKLVTIDPSMRHERPYTDPDSQPHVPQGAQRKGRGPSPMSGRIEEVPLPDLLQLFGTSKKSGILNVHSGDLEGKIYLRTGKIYFACIVGMKEVGPQKAVTRMVGWEEGTFELLGPSDEKFMVELDESTEALLMDAMREKDEIKRIQEKLPDRSAQFALAKPLQRLKDLNEEQMEILQLVHNHGKVQSVLDHSLLSDLDTLQGLLYLIKNGYVAESS